MGAIQKRGDRYRALVRKKGYPPMSQSFGKKVLAERWIRETESAIDSGSLGNSNLTVGQLVKQYRTEVNKVNPFDKRRIGTLKKIEECFADLPLKDLTAKSFIDKITGIANAPSTRQEKVVYLNVAMNYMELVHSVRIPWREITSAKKMLSKLGVTAKSRQRTRRVTEAEVAQILEHMNTTFPMEDIINFAIDSAMRLGEITRIRWEDVDEKKRTVIIRDRKHPKQKKGNDQEVPLLGRCWEIIQRQKGRNGPIFPFQGASVSTAWQRARDKAKIENCRFHDLRHEGVSRLFENGYQVPEVALVSGHRSWECLRIYTQLRPESLHRDAVKDPAVQE